LISKEQSTKAYDAAHAEKYLWLTPIIRLTGLTPENTIEWIPGKPIVFDAVQLHATNLGTELKSNQPGASHKVWNLKMGLLLTFLKEIE
jgi:hypothetical protein